MPIVPASGSSSPAIVRSVVLPAPLRPISARRSRGGSRNETFSNTTLAPYSLLRPVTWRVPTAFKGTGRPQGGGRRVVGFAAMAEIHAQAATSAPPEVVWPLLRDLSQRTAFLPPEAFRDV